MSQPATARPKPINRTRAAKIAVLTQPEVAALLDSFFDGRMVIVIEKVKGEVMTATLEIHEDDLVRELIPQLQANAVR